MSKNSRKIFIEINLSEKVPTNVFGVNFHNMISNCFGTI
jgi:hypothetical protein